MLETLASVIGMILPLILTNNLLLSAVKFLSDGTVGKYMLRVLLGIASIIGILATSAFTGNEIDFNQVSDIAYLTLMTLATGIASHLSYKAVKTAPPAL